MGRYGRVSRPIKPGRDAAWIPKNLSLGLMRSRSMRSTLGNRAVGKNYLGTRSNGSSLSLSVSASALQATGTCTALTSIDPPSLPANFN